MKIKDFKDKKITVMGLGLHDGGVGVAKFFSQAGAKVLITDLRNKQELKESLNKLEKFPIQYVLGQHRPEDFSHTDLVIKNPAVPEKSKYLQIARENKVPIETDVGIFFTLCPAVIIGITGTKGKSTVASLTAQLLKKKYPDVVLAGNIGQSVLAELPKIKKNSLVVLELSSWQLAGLRTIKKSPHIAVLTNIMPDHLNRYQNMAEYIEDKKLIFRWQKPDDYLILNADNQITKNLAKEAKSQVLFFSIQNLNQDKDLLKNIHLLGQHNISNVSAALTISQLYQVPAKTIKKVLNKFKGISGRLELISQINGVKYINDTTATTPEACLAALNSLPANKIILIAGGADKNLDFSQLAETIVKKVKKLIFLEGTATDKLAKAVADRVNSQRVESMAKAVALAQQQAKPGDIVLLSPACASFGMFRHEFERGEKFNQYVQSL